MTEQDTYSGIVVSVHPSHYEVKTEKGTYRCSVRGKLKQKRKKSAMRPAAAGDRVEISIAGEKEGAIEKIKERTNRISRPSPSSPHKEQVIAANVDNLIAVQAFKKPSFTQTLLDQCLAVGEHFEISEQIVCLNKTDLVEDVDEALQKIPSYTELGYHQITVSAHTGDGIKQLRSLMTEDVSVFVGPSGVGKSSLLNSLNPELDLAVGELGKRTEKGTHRTTTMKLLEIDSNTYAIDTPGIDFLSLWDTDFEQVQYYFPEILDASDDCKFSNCLHLKEPGCAVQEGVNNGEIHEGRYESYKQITRALMDDQSFANR